MSDVSKVSTRTKTQAHHIIVGAAAAGVLLQGLRLAGRDGPVQHRRQPDGLRLHRPICLSDAVQDAPGRAVWLAAGDADQFAAFPAQGDRPQVKLH